MNKPPQIFKPEDFEFFEFDVIHEKHTCDPNSRELAERAQAIFEKWWEQHLIEYEHAKVYFYKHPNEDDGA